MKNEKISEAKTATTSLRPPMFIMDTYLSMLDPNSKVAKQVALILVDYEVKCSKAQLEMFEAVRALMEQEMH
jgi:hypothetical protein